jgi:hypothetical protein
MQNVAKLLGQISIAKQQVTSTVVYSIRPTLQNYSPHPVHNILLVFTYAKCCRTVGPAVGGKN